MRQNKPWSSSSDLDPATIQQCKQESIEVVAASQPGLHVGRRLPGMAIGILRAYYSQTMPRAVTIGPIFDYAVFGTRHTRIRHLLKILTECG